MSLVDVLPDRLDARMKLSPDQLLSVLNDGLAAAPRSLDVAAGSKVRTLVASGGLVVATDSSESRELAKAIAPYARFVQDTALQEIERRAVISVPVPLCNCTAAIIDGRECILIFDGHLDVAVANLAMSYAVQQLPEIFDRTFPRGDYPDVTTRSWVSVIFGSMINRSLSHGEALPDFGQLIAPPDRGIELTHGFVGAAWWLLLHELGHLVLGHLRPTPAVDRAVLRLAFPGSVVVPQGLSRYQVEEVDADSYVYECLNDEGQQLFFGWANNALGPTMMLEALTEAGEATHPLTVNRLSHAQAVSEAKDSLTHDLSSAEHLKRHGSTRTAILQRHGELRSQGADPVFSRWSRADLMVALIGMKPIFDAVGLDLEEFARSAKFTWRALMRRTA